MSPSRPRYFLHSYGCQMNKLDSELVESRLLEAGYEAAPEEEQADVVLLNTCAVREHAEDRVWSKLGRLRLRKRQEPGLVVGLLGCMAQEHKRAAFNRMPHLDLVVGPSAFGDIEKKVDAARKRAVEIADAGGVDRSGSGVPSGAAVRAKGGGGGRGRDQDLRGAEILAADHGVSGDTIRRNVGVRSHRSQAYVSIMRGCNMPCTYCIVPTTRGKEISRPLEDIVEEARRLCADGVTEITLLGQTVNAWGRDLGKEFTLARLLRDLHEIDGLKRLAFITSHPNFLSPALIDAFADLPKVARYLHLPAQSGSNRVLKTMRRGYTVERYLARAEALWAKVPEMELHSDWIVGYPGESDEDFEETVGFMERLRFAQSYIFKYSPRPGTIAADLTDDVPDAVKAERNQVLLALQEQHTREKNDALVGSLQEVLVEGPSKVAGRLTGRTQTHRLVHFPSEDLSLTGTYRDVRITEALAHSLVGDLATVSAGS